VACHRRSLGSRPLSSRPDGRHRAADKPEARRSEPYAGDSRAQAQEPPYQGQTQPRKRSAFSRFFRFVLALVALVLVAGAVATGVILTTDKAAGVHISKVAGDDVEFDIKTQPRTP